MGSTRYIIRNFLRLACVDISNITPIIAFLVEKPGYPSLKVIADCLNDFGIQIMHNSFKEGTLPDGSSFAIAPVNSEDDKYVLIMGTKEDHIIYLDSSGEMKKESKTDFQIKWTGEIYVLRAMDLAIMKGAIEHIREERRREQITGPTIRAIRKHGLSNEPFVYRFCRLFSPYLSYIFIKLRIYPNYITFAWLFPVMGAAWLLSWGRSSVAWWACPALIIFGYTLDCSDGEVARVTRKFSRLGGYLDTIIHWVSGPILVIGLAFGGFYGGYGVNVLVSGFACFFGATFFNYISFQLNAWQGTDNPYAIPDPVLKALYWVSPLDLNLILICVLLNRPLCALYVWEYLSFGLAGWMCIRFLLRERRSIGR
jgi:phosphatidylglycerophosphate synthase